MMKSLWHNKMKMLLLQILLLLLTMIQRKVGGVKKVLKRDTEAQKLAFFTYARTNGACVDNFVRLWHEEMSAEERAHWDGIEGLKLGHFDKFIKLFSFSFNSGQVTMDASRFKLIEDDVMPKEAWIFNIYIFKAFNFYFSPTGQISPRNMAKIAFLLCWQRLRQVADKQVNWRFKSFNALEKLGTTYRDVYLCDLLDAAFRMPTAEELKKGEMAFKRAKNEEKMKKLQQQMQGKDKGKGDKAGESSEKALHQKITEFFTQSEKTRLLEKMDIRANFQKFFDKLHASTITYSSTENNRRTKLEAILSQWMDAKYDYWNQLCSSNNLVVNDKLSTALAKFAKHYIHLIVDDDVKNQKKFWEKKQPPSRWRIRSYNEMKQHFAGVPEEWDLIQQIIYKYMEVYGRNLTSFDPYEASELPVLLFMCLFKRATGELKFNQLLSLLENSENKGFLDTLKWRKDVKILMTEHDFSLKQTLDTWKPRWLLTANSENRIYPIEEHLKRKPLQIAGDAKGKDKEVNEENEQIFMPIDEMSVEHVEFLLEAQQHADWKWSEIKAAPIHDIQQNPKKDYMAFDIEAFMAEEDNKIHNSNGDDASIKNEDLFAYYNSQVNNNHLLTFREWVRRSYHLFKLRYLTTTTKVGGESNSNSKTGSSSSSTSLTTMLSEAQRFEFAIQIYLRLFRTFVDKLRELEGERPRQALPALKQFETMNRISATDIGRKLVKLLIAKREAEQTDISAEKKPPVISNCEIAASDDAVTWIDKKLAHFATRPSGNLTATSLLLIDEDHCIEASTRWVHRLFRFDLEAAYQTSLAMKLLRLVSTGQNRVHIGFGEQRLMEELFNGVNGQHNRKKAKEDLNKIFATVDTKLWQWTQRRLETMVAMLPQKGEPLEHHVPEWAVMFKQKLRTKRTIQRAQYQVEALDLVRLFAYVQLGAMISLNHLIVEKLWTDLMNGMRTLETTMFNIGEENGSQMPVLHLRAKFIGNLHSLNAYIAHWHYQETMKVPGLQPIAIRPKHQQGEHNHEGKNIFDLAKIFERHEALRKEMGKKIHKITDKMLAKKEEWRRKRQQQHQQHSTSTSGGSNPHHQKNTKNSWTTDSHDGVSYYFVYHQESSSGEKEEAGDAGGEDGEIFDLSDWSNAEFDGNTLGFDFLPDFSNFVDLDLSDIFAWDFSTDGWNDIIGSASDLVMNLVQEAKSINFGGFFEKFGNLFSSEGSSGGADSTDALANAFSNFGAAMGGIGDAVGGTIGEIGGAVGNGIGTVVGGFFEGLFGILDAIAD